MLLNLSSGPTSSNAYYTFKNANEDGGLGFQAGEDVMINLQFHELPGAVPKNGTSKIQQHYRFLNISDFCIKKSTKKLVSILWRGGGILSNFIWQCHWTISSLGSRKKLQPFTSP